MYYFTGRLIISYRFLDIFTVAEYMINDKELNFASSGQDDAKYKWRQRNLNETKKMLTKQNTQKNGSLKTGKLKNNNKLKTTQWWTSSKSPPEINVCRVRNICHWWYQNFSTRSTKTGIILALMAVYTIKRGFESQNDKNGQTVSK